ATGAVVVSPDGALLAGGSTDHKLHLWAIKENKPIHFMTLGIPVEQAASFCADSRMLAAACDDTIYLWELASREDRVRILGPHGRCSPVVLSPNGRMLAFGASDMNVHVWSLPSGKEIHRFEGHQGMIHSLAFSPDGNLLVSTSDDTTALVWDTSALVHPISNERRAGPEETMEDLWTKLGDHDAAVAYRAIWHLVSTPLDAILLFRERVKPAHDVEDRDRLFRLITDLDNNSFRVRMKATEELERLGHVAEPALRDALERRPSPEVRRRIELLLANVDG